MTSYGLDIVTKYANRHMQSFKIEYVDVKIEDLLDIYVLHIRSVAEYCSVVFHSRLTEEYSMKLERIQRTCLKVILSDMYINYESALEKTGLDTLENRREKRCLNLSLKCTKHDQPEIISFSGQ